MCFFIYLQPKKPFQRVNVDEIVYTENSNSYYSKVRYNLHCSLYSNLCFINAFIEVCFTVL